MWRPGKLFYFPALDSTKKKKKAHIKSAGRNRPSLGTLLENQREPWRNLNLEPNEPEKNVTKYFDRRVNDFTTSTFSNFQILTKD